MWIYFGRTKETKSGSDPHRIWKKNLLLIGTLVGCWGRKIPLNLVLCNHSNNLSLQLLQLMLIIIETVWPEWYTIFLIRLFSSSHMKCLSWNICEFVSPFIALAILDWSESSSNRQIYLHFVVALFNLCDHP